MVNSRQLRTKVDDELNVLTDNSIKSDWEHNVYLIVAKTLK